MYLFVVCQPFKHMSALPVLTLMLLLNEIMCMIHSFHVSISSLSVMLFLFTFSFSLSLLCSSSLSY